MSVLETKKNKIKITCDSVKEFDMVHKTLAELPPVIFNQIELAEVGINDIIICSLKNEFRSPMTVNLPSCVSVIKPTEKQTYIYFYEKNYIFRLSKDITRNEIIYNIIKEQNG